ncbi:MAG: GntR family transcriptional regulator [Chromatiales bacterium]|nr:GntR family transcriptional regulator [Chromatiales bacterium]
MKQRGRETGPASAATSGRRRLGSAQRTVTPLYHQMYLALRDKIRGGIYPPDRPLPGEHQLAQDFGVSRVTVRRTLENLEIDGLVVRRRGVGTFPVAAPVEHRDRYNIGGLVAAGRVPPGTDTDHETLAAGLCRAPRRVLGFFPSTGDLQLFRIQRRRSFRGQPFAILTAWTWPQHGERLAELAERTGGIPAALEEMALELGRAEQAITARSADEEAAAYLQVPVGMPLLAMKSMVTDREDRTVCLMESLFHPDRYEYRTTMLRRRGAAGERWRIVS